MVDILLAKSSIFKLKILKYGLHVRLSRKRGRLLCRGLPLFPQLKAFLVEVFLIRV